MTEPVATDFRDLVARKRDGLELDPGELRAFVLAYARGEVADYLAAAFLMATYLRGLTPAETSAMTGAMIDSGETLPLAGISRPKVDKHSTGGVSDGVTLAFAPLAAALGLGVAKLSGRGLGHTGGTLDKLESIPGLTTSLAPDAFERQVAEIGCAVAGQTADLVPADGLLYALRDATATVSSLPLIAASVMSKKLAVATDLILLDVKAGGGAFMKTPEAAEELARACVRLADDRERPAVALVTDMSEPLGTAVGNALEIEEIVRLLRGEDPRGTGRLRALVLRFAALALEELEGGASEEAGRRAAEALASGAAAERFARMVEAQGGDPRVVEDPVGVLPRAPVVVPLPTPGAGWLGGVDAEAIGRAAVDLGAGRRRKGEAVDPAVGIVLEAKLGDRMEAGGAVGAVHARTREAAEAAVRAVHAALRVGDEPCAPPPLVHAVVRGGAAGAAR